MILQKCIKILLNIQTHVHIGTVKKIRKLKHCRIKNTHYHDIYFYTSREYIAPVSSHVKNPLYTAFGNILSHSPFN